MNELFEYVEQLAKKLLYKQYGYYLHGLPRSDTVFLGNPKHIYAYAVRNHDQLRIATDNAILKYMSYKEALAFLGDIESADQLEEKLSAEAAIIIALEKGES